MKNKILLIFILNSFSVFCQLLYNTAKSGLIIRDKPSIEGNRIGKLKYLELVNVIEKTNKTYTLKDKHKKIVGEWVKIKHKSNSGFIFNGFLAQKEDLRKMQNKIDYYSVIINGKLKYKCNINDFLNHIGEPDSIIANKLKYKENISVNVKIIEKFKDKYKYKSYEYFDDIECSHNHGNCHNTQTFYKNGICYEEMNNEMKLVSIDLSNSNNYIKYGNKIWNNKTDLKDILETFPLIKTYENKNLKTIFPHDHFFAEIKWYMHISKKNKLIEFGL